MKPRPERVSSALAKTALENAKGDTHKVYTQYIVLHFRSTGNLAPGCDAKDLLARLKLDGLIT